MIQKQPHNCLHTRAFYLHFMQAQVALLAQPSFRLWEPRFLVTHFRYQIFWSFFIPCVVRSHSDLQFWHVCFIAHNTIPSCVNFCTTNNKFRPRFFFIGLRDATNDRGHMHANRAHHCTANTSNLAYLRKKTHVQLA